MSTTSHAVTRDLPDVDQQIISQAGGENPLRFLAMKSTTTAIGLIAGIQDLDRIDAWRQCELEHVDPPRDQILDALDEREAELRDEPLSDESVEESPASAGTPDPIDQRTHSEPPSDPEPTPADIHPDGDLDPGEVIVVDRGPKTEYIFPTTSDSNEPYLSRAYNEDGSLWMELAIDGDDLRKRREHDHERTDVEQIDVEPPEQAATAEVLPA